MKMKRCPNGHYYTGEEDSICPYCGGQPLTPPGDSGACPCPHGSSYADCAFCGRKSLKGGQSYLGQIHGYRFDHMTGDPPWQGCAYLANQAEYRVDSMIGDPQWRGCAYLAHQVETGEEVIIEQYYSIWELNAEPSRCEFTRAYNRTIDYYQFVTPGGTMFSPAGQGFRYRDYEEGWKTNRAFTELFTELDFFEWENTECFVVKYREGTPLSVPSAGKSLRLPRPVEPGPAAGWLLILESQDSKSVGRCYPLFAGDNYLARSSDGWSACVKYNEEPWRAACRLFWQQGSPGSGLFAKAMESEPVNRNGYLFSGIAQLQNYDQFFVNQTKLLLLLNSDLSVIPDRKVGEDNKTSKTGGINMEMKRCPNGHYYNPEKDAECPYCKGPSANFTIPLNVNSQAAPPRQTAPSSDVGPTMPLTPPAVYGGDDSEKTIALIQKEIGIDPVVGWLVCTDGVEKGRDYRLHAGNNTVGRGDAVDVSIKGDKSISRENNAIVSYDMQDKIYYFTPRDGREIPKINSRPVFNTCELKAYDTIQLGETKLMFMPFCGKEFDWK